tara:strand:+ start:1781 stop:2782 length:1002 start_codon:yes stop_codon:yes gene_type:complete
MNIKLDKIKNLYSSEYSTPINIIKNTVNNFVDDIFNNLENNTNLNNIYLGVINEDDGTLDGDGILITSNKVLVKGKFNTLNYIDNMETTLTCNKYNNIYLKGNVINNDFIYGTIEYNNITLSGEFKEGYPNNQCKYISNNIIYDGDWNNGIISGNGYYQDNNLKYTGSFHNGKFHGLGKLIQDDCEYDGSFYYGKKHGKGDFIKDSNKFYVEYEHDKQIIKLDYNEKKILDLEKCLNNQNKEINDFKYIIKFQENQILTYNNVVKNLEKEKKNIEETFLCKVCFNNIPNILLKPCLHVAICDSCEETIRNHVSNKKCPICRKAYHTATSIFIC